MTESGQEREPRLSVEQGADKGDLRVPRAPGEGVRGGRWADRGRGGRLRGPLRGGPASAMLLDTVDRPRSQRPPDLRPLLERRPAPFEALPPAARQQLLLEAARHGLLSVVAPRLPEGDPALRARFERLAQGALLADARLREVLEEALSALSAIGVVPVALKGPVLADRIYSAPALRPSGDLDLLVAEEELERAAAALVERGFRRADPLVDAYQRRRLHHLHLGRSPGPDVELHFTPQSAFGARFPAAELFARSLLFRTGSGTPVRVLAPEDELVTLAVHAAGHLFERGGWILDLVLFLERHPGLLGSVIRERSGAFRCRRSLAYALRRAASLGAPLPSGSPLALDPLRRSMCDRLSRFSPSRHGRWGALVQMAFQMVLRDRALGAIALVGHEAFWVVRRRAHLAARSLTRRRPPAEDRGR